MPGTHPKHRRHEWSAIRELRTPSQAPRHAANRTLDRLGANSPDVRELMEAAFVGNPFQGRAR